MVCQRDIRHTQPTSQWLMWADVALQDVPIKNVKTSIFPTYNLIEEWAGDTAALKGKYCAPNPTTSTDRRQRIDVAEDIHQHQHPKRKEYAARAQVYQNELLFWKQYNCHDCIRYSSIDQSEHIWYFLTSNQVLCFCSTWIALEG